MDKLEKRITERAEKKFNLEFMALMELISKNSIGSRLKIVDKEGKLVPFVNNYGHTSQTFFNHNYKNLTEKAEELTNIKDVKATLIKKYEQEESDELLNKLDVLRNYLG